LAPVLAVAIWRYSLFQKGKEMLQALEAQQVVKVSVTETKVRYSVLRIIFCYIFFRVHPKKVNPFSVGYLPAGSFRNIAGNRISGDS
jgi:hypothetical protein